MKIAAAALMSLAVLALSACGGPAESAETTPAVTVEKLTTEETCSEIEAILVKHGDEHAAYAPALLELLPTASTTTADALKAVAENDDPYDFIALAEICGVLP